MSLNKFPIPPVQDRPFVPYMRADLDKLLEKAVLASRKDDGIFPMHNCSVMYRNKPWQYFADIRAPGSDKTMKRYYKDGEAVLTNGDPRSPINHPYFCQRPKVIFFGCNVDLKTGLPPNTSFAGDTRLEIPLAGNLDPNHYKIYFADLYCSAGRTKTHKVTLVIVDPTDQEHSLYIQNIDEWCRLNLIRLPWYQNTERYNAVANEPIGQVHGNTKVHQLDRLNPFLHFNTIENTWKVNGKVWIELLYTKDIKLDNENLNHLGANLYLMPNVKEDEGIKYTEEKTKGCKICNLC